MDLSPCFSQISFQAASKKINLCVFHSSEYAIAPFLCYSCLQRLSLCGSNQPLKTLSLLENKGVIIHTDEFQSWVEQFHAVNIWLCCLYTYCLGLFCCSTEDCVTAVWHLYIRHFKIWDLLCFNFQKVKEKSRSGPLVHSQNADSLRANSIAVGYFCWNIWVQLLSVLISCSSIRYWYDTENWIQVWEQKSLFCGNN